MKFYEILRKTRIENNITIQKMADELGISNRGYRYYETGERTPSFSTLIKICDIFNVSADYMLGRTKK